MIVVANIYNDYKEKFGIPRQSGMVKSVLSEIVFTDQFKNAEAVRGIEEYSHLWLLWGFSENHWNGSLTVCPPRLGGKEKKGVFATRSSFRPNSIGMSVVKLEQVTSDNRGTVLIVSGADILNGSPIYDIKPYLPYADAINDAEGSFGEEHKDERISVDFPKEFLNKLPERMQNCAIELLSLDPRAAFNKKPDYIYGLRLGDFDIRFMNDKGVLRVVDVADYKDEVIKKIK